MAASEGPVGYAASSRSMDGSSLTWPFSSMIWTLAVKLRLASLPSRL